MFGYIFYYVCLILSCIITSILGLVTVQRKVNKGAAAFSGIMFGAAVFSFCYIFKASSFTLYKAFFWLKAAYIGIVSIPVFWYVMVHQYTGAYNKLSKKEIAALFIIPSITLLILYTNSYHNLFYSSLMLVRPDNISMIHNEKGPWYWVHMIYSYSLVAIGCVRLIKEWRQSGKVYRSRLGIILLCTAIPWITNLLYQVHKTPQGMDISAVSYAVAGLYFAWGMYRYGVFELVPIARDCIFEAMQDGVIVLDIQNRIVDFNQKAKSIMAENAVLKAGLKFNERLTDKFEISNKAILGKKEQFEAKIKVGNGISYYSCIISPIMNKKNNMLGKMLIMRDITEQIKYREHLRTYAIFDGLTGIYNRRHFIELSHKYLEGIESKKYPAAVVLFDIDLFKQINDSYGHEAGDVVLCAVAKVLEDCLRNTDIYSRYGGDEFICLLPNTSSRMAIEIAERIRRMICQLTLDYYGNPLRITASFGVAGIKANSRLNLSESIRIADKALYDAKSKGRNCVCIFSGELDECV